MRVVASEVALQFVRERGGRLYVWTTTSRCCHGGLTLLRASTEPTPGREFRRAASDQLDVFLPTQIKQLPEELHLDLHRFPRSHVEAYWDGCAWVV